MVPNKKLIISHFVALALGFLSGLIGHDLSPLQKPAEQAVGVAVDAAEEAAKQKIAEDALKKLAAEAPPPPAPAPVDAGVVVPVDPPKHR